MSLYIANGKCIKFINFMQLLYFNFSSDRISADKCFIYLSPKKAHRTPYEMGKGVLTANLVSVFVCTYYTAFNLVIGVHYKILINFFKS